MRGTNAKTSPAPKISGDKFTHLSLFERKFISKPEIVIKTPTEVIAMLDLLNLLDINNLKNKSI